MNIVNHLQRQREFSLKTFGPGYRTLTVIYHIRKELQEIEESPEDLEEWVDVILLAFDGAWRSGHEPLQIAQSITERKSVSEYHVAHMSNMLHGLEQSPSDLRLWAAIVMLAFDGANKQGYPDEQIYEAIECKQSKNELRNWPDWQQVPDGQVMEHVR